MTALRIKLILETHYKLIVTSIQKAGYRVVPSHSDQELVMKCAWISYFTILHNIETQILMEIHSFLRFVAT